MIKIGLNENNEYYLSDLSNEKTEDLDKYEQIAIKLKADGILYDGITLNDDGTLIVEDLSYQNPLLIGTVIESGSAGYYTIDYNYGSLDIGAYQANSYSYQKLGSIILYDDGQGNVTTLKTLWDSAITQMQSEPDYVDYLPYITYSIGAGAAGYFIDFVDSYDEEAQKEYKVHSLALQVQNISVFYATANAMANIYPDVTSMLKVIHGNLVIFNKDLLEYTYGLNLKKIEEKISYLDDIIDKSMSNLNDYIEYIEDIFEKNPDRFSQVVIENMKKEFVKKKKINPKSVLDKNIYSDALSSLYELAITSTNIDDFSQKTKDVMDSVKDLYKDELKVNLSYEVDKVIQKNAQKSGLVTTNIAVTKNFGQMEALGEFGTMDMFLPDVDSGKDFQGTIYLSVHGYLPSNEDVLDFYPKYLAESIYGAMVKAGATPEDFANIKEIIFGNCHNNQVLADYVVASFYDLLESNGITPPESIGYSYITDNSFATIIEYPPQYSKNKFLNLFSKKEGTFLYKTFVYQLQPDSVVEILDNLYMNPKYKPFIKQNIGIPSKLVDLNSRNPHMDLLTNSNIVNKEEMFSNDNNSRQRAKDIYSNYSEVIVDDTNIGSLIKTVVPINYKFDNTKSSGENFNNLIASLKNTIEVMNEKELPQDIQSEEYKKSLVKLLKDNIKINPFSITNAAVDSLVETLKIDKRILINILLENKDLFIRTPEEMFGYTGVDFNTFIRGALDGYSGNINVESIFSNSSKSLAEDKLNTILYGISGNINAINASGSSSGGYFSITGNNKKEEIECINNNLVILEDMRSKEPDAGKRKKIIEDIEYQKRAKEEINSSKTKERAMQIADGFGKAGDVLDYYGMLISVVDAGELSLTIDFDDPDSIGAFCNTVGFIEGVVMVGAQLEGIAVGKIVKNMSGISYEGFKTKRAKSMEKMQGYALPLDAVLTIGAAYSIFATLDKNSKTYGYMITLGVLTIANFGVEVASFFLRACFYPSIILDIVGFVIGLVSNLVGAATSIVGLDHFSAGEKCKDFFAALFGFSHNGELDQANEALYDQIDSIYDNGGKDNYKMIISGYFNNYSDLYMSFGYCGTGVVKNDNVSDIGNSQDGMHLYSTSFTWDNIKDTSDKNKGLGHSYIRTSSSETANGVAYIACKNHNVHQDFNNCPYPLTIFAGYLPAVAFYSGNKIVEEWNPKLCWGEGNSINDNYGPIITLTGLNSNMFIIGDDQDITLTNGNYVCQDWGACGDYDGKGLSASPNVGTCGYYTKYWQSYYNILSPSYVDTSDKSYGKMILHLEQVSSKLNVDLSKPTINMLGDISGYNINNVLSPHTVLRALVDTNRTLATDFSVISNVFINNGTTLTTHNKDLVVQTNNNATINAQDLNDDSNVVIYAGYNDTVNMTGTTAAVEVII